MGSFPKWPSLRLFQRLYAEGHIFHDIFQQMGISSGRLGVVEPGTQTKSGPAKLPTLNLKDEDALALCV